MAVQAYVRPQEIVMPFKYLGILLTAMGINWPVVITNLQNARKSWDRFSRIMVQEGPDTRMSWRFYFVIVKGVLFFGTDNWAGKPHIGRLLGGFHQRVAWQVSGKESRRKEYGN